VNPAFLKVDHLRATSFQSHADDPHRRSASAQNEQRREAARQEWWAALARQLEQPRNREIENRRKFFLASEVIVNGGCWFRLLADFPNGGVAEAVFGVTLPAVSNEAAAFREFPL
jgi:hypothetical protein